MAQKRLIDANDLLIAFSNALNNAPGRVGYGFMEWVVNEQPTIDPETLRPVAHIIRGTVPETKDGVFCDNCNRHLGDEYGAHVIGYFKYCPYCGFRLEDGTEEIE